MFPNSELEKKIDVKLLPEAWELLLDEVEESRSSDEIQERLNITIFKNLKHSSYKNLSKNLI